MFFKVKILIYYFIHRKMEDWGTVGYFLIKSLYQIVYNEDGI